MAQAGSGGARGGNGAGAPPSLDELRARQRVDDRAVARAAAEKAARTEAEALKQRVEDEHGGAPPTAHAPDAGLIEVGRALLGAMQETAHASGATVAAFTSLAKADVALARASVVSAAVLGLAGAVAAVTTWLLLVALLVVGLVNAGLALWMALGAAALVTVLVAAALVLFARSRLAGAGMQATRRQWHQLRHGGHGQAPAPVHSPPHPSPRGLQ